MQVVKIWLLIIVTSHVTGFPSNSDLMKSALLTPFEMEPERLRNSGYPDAWQGLPAGRTSAFLNHRRNIFGKLDPDNKERPEVSPPRRKRFLETLLYPFVRPIYMYGLRRRLLRRRGRRPIYGRPFYFFSPTYGYSITPYYDSYDFGSGYADDFDYDHDYAIDYGFDDQNIEYDDYGSYGDYGGGGYDDYGLDGYGEYGFGGNGDYGFGGYGDYGFGDYGDYRGGGYGDFGAGDFNGGFDRKYSP